MTPLQECHRKLEYLKRYMALKIDDRLPLDYPGYMLFVRDPFFKGWPQEFDKWYKTELKMYEGRNYFSFKMDEVASYPSIDVQSSTSAWDQFMLQGLPFSFIKVYENPLFPFKMSDGSECIGAMISGSQVIPIINKENPE